MSYLYFHGQGVGQDVFEALYWAELAARQGHRGAVSNPRRACGPHDGAADRRYPPPGGEFSAARLERRISSIRRLPATADCGFLFERGSHGPDLFIDGVIPVVHPEAFVHPTAVLIGDVIIGPGLLCRALRIAAWRFRPVDPGARIQPPGWLRQHGFSQHRYGDRGRRPYRPWAILHGLPIRRDALVGMNATVMDGAVIGESAMVAAMAFVRAGFEVPPRTLAAGIPPRSCVR